MSKFKKAISDDGLEPFQTPNTSKLASGHEESLKFTVQTSNRLFVEFDLTRYHDGDSRLGLLGFPNLIKDLLPTIKRNICQGRRTRRAVICWLSSFVSPLFSAVTDMKRQTGLAPERIDQFQDSDGVFLQRYLMGLNGGKTCRKKQYTGIRSIILEARSKTAPRLRWPSFDIAPERKVHADVDVRAVKALYQVCKRAVEDAERNFHRGQLLLAEGVDPRDSGSTRLWQKGRRGGVANHAWRNPANLAVLQRKMIQERIVGAGQIEKQTIDKLNRVTSPSGQPFVGIALVDLVAASAPSPLEVIAAIILVSMETGWIDTVWGIDLTSEWYSLRRGDEITSLKKTDSVVLYAVRPKTSKKLTAIGLAGARFRSFQLIRELQSRTAFLRECLRERRVLLEGNEPNPTAHAEIAELDSRLRSPWLFYNAKGAGTQAVGLANSGSVRAGLVGLKARAVATLSPSQQQDENLVAAIEALKWSDLRDALASHIFDNSAGNIFLVKRALNHNNVATTRSYLRQRRQIRQRFDAFRKIMDTAMTEVKQGRYVDPTVLFLTSNFTNFSDFDREKLTAYRTRMGMGCVNPTDPDVQLAPNHIEGALCAVQRCVLCRHGIVFKEAYEGLADRHADLVWLRSKTPPNRWLTSSLSWELEAIELVRDRVFTDRIDAFNMRSEQRLADITAGRADVFDDPEITGGLR